MKPVYEYNEETGEISRRVGEEQAVLLARFDTIANELRVLSADGERYLARVGRVLSDMNLKVAKVHHYLDAGAPGSMPNATPAIPPAPPMTKRHGDKTPAYVEWLRTYHPDEFEKRFGVLGRGTVTKIAVDHEPVTNKPIARPYQQEALLSTRKTHLTEKPEARD